ncbi:MAG: biopolymer transporter ExbD [Bacteroidota bacterium]
MKRTIERRNAPEVNAGSMADIAFLLLIFFLVTTTIMSDSGLLVKLPPWDPNPPQENIRMRNLFRVAINSQNAVLVRGEEQPLTELKDAVKAFIMNPEGNPEFAAAPNKAIVSLVNDRSTSYETYLEVYNELKAAYNELWEQAAQQRYDRSYHELSQREQATIRQDIPLIISEAEPTDHAPAEG